MRPPWYMIKLDTSFTFRGRSGKVVEIDHSGQSMSPVLVRWSDNTAGRLTPYEWAETKGPSFGERLFDVIFAVVFFAVLAAAILGVAIALSVAGSKAHEQDRCQYDNVCTDANGEQHWGNN